jgi:uncharacterized protein YvpB
MVVLALVVAGLTATAGLWFSSHSTLWAAAARAWGRFSYRAVAPYEGDILLPVPFDAQDHALSCEAAALKMALAYRGVAVTEDDIMDLIGYDPTPRTKDANGTVHWGDPNTAFVGSIDGRMMSTGYGVHWKPVARAANEWRLAQVIQGWTATEAAQQLALGNPIIAWGYVGPGTPYEWLTPDGKRVRTVLREHAFVLNGFRGTVDAPEGFYFMDPVYGQRYLPTADFLKNWGVFGNAGVILY